MGKGYVGVKFRREKNKEERKSYNNKEKELKEACRYLADKNLAPALGGGGYGGNASFKTDNRIIIIASGSNLGELKDKDLVEVFTCSYDKFKCEYNGKKPPSSETVLHWMIYRTLPDSMEISSILHGHYDPVVNNAEELRIPETENFQGYGSKELVEEVVNLLDKEPTNEFIAKDHGFFVLGKSIEGAKKRVGKMYKKAQDI